MCLCVFNMTVKARGQTRHRVWGRRAFHFVLLLLPGHRQIYLDISDLQYEEQKAKGRLTAEHRKQDKVDDWLQWDEDRGEERAGDGQKRHKEREKTEGGLSQCEEQLENKERWEENRRCLLNTVAHWGCTLQPQSCSAGHKVKVEPKPKYRRELSCFQTFMQICVFLSAVLLLVWGLYNLGDELWWLQSDENVNGHKQREEQLRKAISLIDAAVRQWGHGGLNAAASVLDADQTGRG